MLKKFSQRAHLLAAFVALILSLSLVSEVSAAALANGDFESSKFQFHYCTTAGWAETNDVTPTTAGNANLYYDPDECVAKIYAVASRASMSTGWQDESTMSQTFDVSATDRTLIFNVFADSEDGYSYLSSNQGTYITQWIALYDPNGVEIYKKGRNTYGRNHLTFAYGLPTSYTFSQITLKVRTVTTNLNIGAPSWVALYIDKVHWAPGIPFGTNNAYW